ncbi:histidine phosphatase family protein [Streptomyces mirabilis]|uniref:histidine phosphatase family protein n=1 Tax=Streptomyces mirabilis TaxID=68239 RepID=UPI0033A0D087
MDSKALRLAGTPLSGRDLAERAAIQKDASIPFEQVRADLETIRQPVLYGRPHAQPDRPWAGGSDTWNGYLRRTGDFLRGFVDRHEGDRVLFAAHGETVIVTHALRLAIPLGSPAGFTVSHGSIGGRQHHLNRLGQRRQLLDWHKDTAHLGSSAMEAASSGPTPHAATPPQPGASPRSSTTASASHGSMRSTPATGRPRRKCAAVVALVCGEGLAGLTRSCHPWKVITLPQP